VNVPSECAAGGRGIQEVILAGLNPAGYAAAYPTCDITRADMDLNGAVNTVDIPPFVSYLLTAQ